MSGVRLETPETGPGTRSSEADSQATRALDALRASLLSGEFAPGERMAELSLVARLGVSRTPIRLALERLAHMGLLDLNASGGFTVRGYTRAEALDAIEIRGVLEGTAARLAAERLTDSAEVAPLRRLCEEVDRIECLTLETSATFLERNEAFHAAIVELAKSAMLERSYQHAVSLPFASPGAIEFPASAVSHGNEALAIAKEHHRGIVEAITKRQGMRAENLAREHALLARRVLSMALSDPASLTTIPGRSLIDAPRHRRTRTT